MKTVLESTHMFKSTKETVSKRDQVPPLIDQVSRVAQEFSFDLTTSHHWIEKSRKADYDERSALVPNVSVTNVAAAW